MTGQYGGVDALVPEYLAGLIYGGVCDSLASELAARRTAMDAGNKKCRRNDRSAEPVL